MAVPYRGPAAAARGAGPVTAPARSGGGRRPGVGLQLAAGWSEGEDHLLAAVRARAVLEPEAWPGPGTLSKAMDPAVAVAR